MFLYIDTRVHIIWLLLLRFSLTQLLTIIKTVSQYLMYFTWPFILRFLWMCACLLFYPQSGCKCVKILQFLPYRHVAFQRLNCNLCFSFARAAWDFVWALSLIFCVVLVLTAECALFQVFSIILVDVYQSKTVCVSHWWQGFTFTCI